MTSYSASAEPVDLDIWGARGSRNLVPPRSQIGNNTSCYSILQGEDLLVFDGGGGLAALGHAVDTEPRFEKVKRISLFVGHAHMDHWEGLKDSDWFWRETSGLELEVFGPGQALESIRAGFGHPSFVPLEILAEGNLAHLGFTTLEAGRKGQLRAWEYRTYRLNHYSGSRDRKRYLDTLGIRLTPHTGKPTICYLCDHEPTEETRSLEKEILSGAQLAFLDAHFPDIASHAYGHGSQEHAARLAWTYPDVLFLATHHGPAFSDEDIRASFERHSRGLDNLRLAVEGTTLSWDEDKGFI